MRQAQGALPAAADLSLSPTPANNSVRHTNAAGGCRQKQMPSARAPTSQRRTAHTIPRASTHQRQVQRPAAVQRYGRHPARSWAQKHAPLHTLAINNAHAPSRHTHSSQSTQALSRPCPSMIQRHTCPGPSHAHACCAPDSGGGDGTGSALLRTPPCCLQGSCRSAAARARPRPHET